MSTSPNPQQLVYCTTKDGDEIAVEVEDIIDQSPIIDQMLGDVLSYLDGDDEDDSEQKKKKIELPLTNVPTDVFKRIVEWCKEHKGLKPPEVKEDPITRQRVWFTFTDFEKQFFDSMAVDELAAILNAVNFLDIKSLYYYGCQALAAWLQGKSPEEIREALGLEDDLTDEEKEQIRRENVWLTE